tara:strand:+ start:819 stop:1184 length:366 start_codon:yes stop_codon:yes gene_type:complete
MAESKARSRAEGKFFKTFNRSGNLAVTTGTQRYYLAYASFLKNVEAYVNTAPVGADANISIIKNGSTTIKTLSISAGATSSGDNTTSISLAEGDYLTVDITQIGSSTAGADLYVNLSFNRG